MSGADDAAVQRIRADREHGASWLAREAARALAQAATGDGDDPAARLAEAHMLARDLARARPSMAAIANTVAHVWWVAAQATAAPARLAALRAEALAVDARWGAAVEGMTQWARGAVGGAVYTLSRSGSVEAALAMLARERSPDDPLRVIVSESRPGGEGVALAKALAVAGARVTLAPDGACAALMDEAALVIVGADSVRADGSVVNKVGTHTLALVARAAGKPVYALAESLKVTPPSYPLVIEEMAPGELLAEPVAGVTTRAIVFDVTPSALITSVITESGPVDANEIARLAAEAERAYQSLMR
jgi:translation initiation factor 2B subunit (eIF-2B alpha/beta/delta family)